MCSRRVCELPVGGGSEPASRRKGAQHRDRATRLVLFTAGPALHSPRGGLASPFCSPALCAPSLPAPRPACTLHLPVPSVHLHPRSTCTPGPAAPLILLCPWSACTPSLPAPSVHWHPPSTSTLHPPVPWSTCTLVQLRPRSSCTPGLPAPSVHLHPWSTCAPGPPAPSVQLHPRSACALGSPVSSVQLCPWSACTLGPSALSGLGPDHRMSQQCQGGQRAISMPFSTSLPEGHPPPILRPKDTGPDK